MRDDCDVLVVGAGLAGLVAARNLAGRGVRVTLVDAKPALERRVHTTGISSHFYFTPERGIDGKPVEYGDKLFKVKKS